MTINGIPKLDTKDGRFFVLIDYRQEGISVKSQHHDPVQAIKSLEKGDIHAPVTVVGVVDIDPKANDPEAEPAGGKLHQEQITQLRIGLQSAKYAMENALEFCPEQTGHENNLKLAIKATEQKLRESVEW